MKKIITLVVLLIMIFSLTACGSEGDVPSTTSSQPPVPNNADTSTQRSADTPSSEPSADNIGENSKGEKILIAYFTVPERDGVDAVSSASRVVVNGEVVGNTQFIAQAIQQSTGGDLFAIETVQEYPEEHDPLVNQAADEKDKNARPELSTSVDNMDEYDVIFVGYPIWWADMPMPLYTFLEEYDLRGKTIIPFSSHGGSSFSNTINTIAGLQRNATIIKNGFTVSRDSVSDAENDIVTWIQDLGFQE